jgi:hypothetical protein
MNKLQEKEDTVSLADVERKIQTHFVTFKRKINSPSPTHERRKRIHLIYYEVQPDAHIITAKDNTNPANRLSQSPT